MFKSFGGFIVKHTHILAFTSRVNTPNNLGDMS